MRFIPAVIALSCSLAGGVSAFGQPADSPRVGVAVKAATDGRVVAFCVSS